MSSENNQNQTGENRKSVICLFDVDGTLTDPRQVLNPHFVHKNELRLIFVQSIHKENYTRNGKVYGKFKKTRNGWPRRRLGFSQNIRTTRR